MKTHKNRYFRQISDIKEKLEDGISEYVSFFFFLDANLGGAFLVAGAYNNYSLVPI